MSTTIAAARPQSRTSLANTSASHATSDLSPYSTLGCQVQATNEWRVDLRSLLNDAKERFADISWTFDGDEREAEAQSEISHYSSLFSAANHPQESVIWAHKAILYARTSNVFQARYLRLKAPAAQLGAGFASSSTISLPVIDVAPDEIPRRNQRPASSIRSTAASTKRRQSVRGSAPPTSFVSISRKERSRIESDGEENYPPAGSKPGVKRTKSNLSVASSNISRPFSRGERMGWQGDALRPSGSYSSLDRAASTDGGDSEALSVISTSSTIRQPMTLHDISPAFFEASLEYIYTAEESAMEVFDFLHDDRMSSKDGAQERLEKLRQDFVFMWRSRLYADIKIVLGEEGVGNIPDATASVLSLPLNDEDDDDQQPVFYAHRMILASRSPYFAAQLLSPYADAHNHIVRLPSPPFTPAAMHFTLGFMYTGTLFFSNRTFDLSTAFQLWLSGSYLGIESLQALITSLVAQDFCHGFACSPPCKTCVRRVPRTMVFVSRPDVSDFRLRQLAQDALAGDHFGSYWWKEVGGLQESDRQSIVERICEKIDDRPGFGLKALRQISVVGARVDVERNSAWIDALRSMCEQIQSHLCSNISANFDAMVKSEEWSSLVTEIGFSNDVFETVLSTLLENMREAYAARNYETLVGNVLLNDERPPPSHILQMCEEARACISAYVKKRWINIRLAGGFNVIQKWCLKELADEIDVVSDDLLLPATDAIAAARHNAITAAGPVSTWAGRRSLAKRPQPGSVIEGEREAGPIHLRAAVLNRNAARASVGQRTVSTATSAAESIIDTGSILSGESGTPIAPVRASMGQRRVSSQSQSRDRGTGMSRPAAVTSLTTSTTSSAAGPSRAFLSSDPARNSRLAATGKQRQRSLDLADKTRSTSNASKMSDVKTNSQDSGSRTTRARLSSTASNVSQRSAVMKARQPTKANAAPSAIPTPQSQVTSAATLKATDAMQIDTEPASYVGGTHSAHTATTLTMGIPCIIAPSMRHGKPARFRAIVKYIGPLRGSYGEQDVQTPVIGVEVPMPLPVGVDEKLYDFHDGSHCGTRYFTLGSSRDGHTAELQHKPEREERRRRIEQMLQRETGSLGYGGDVTEEDRSAKRRKDLLGTGQEALHSAASTRGLFIKPSEVLWVVI